MIRAVLLALGVVGSSLACGGFFCNIQQPVVQSGENILFSMRDKKITTTIQIAYTGEASDFSWVLPLPNTPESFDVASDSVFRALHQFTDPSFSVSVNTTCGRFSTCALRYYAEAANRAPDANAGKVRILLTGDVGPFTYTVIAATESDKTGAALFQWLKENKFGVPEIAMPIVARYVRLNFRFVTLKLQKGKAVGELVPIVIRYAAPSTVDMSCVPLRLTAVAAQEMPVFVWIAGDYRAVPQNFVHLTPDLRKLPWIQCGVGNNYGDAAGGVFTAFGSQSTCTKEYIELLKATAKEFGVQKWLTTEFAGALPQDMLNAIYNANAMPFDKTKLANAKSAQEFLALAINGLPFDLRTSPVMQALLKEFIPKPDDVSEQCKSDMAFYAIGGNCLDAFDDFDAKATADAIEARLIAPTRNARAELAKFPYMTRFYGVFAPQNMVRDPIFRFVKDSTLPAVDNKHTITASFQCDTPTFDVKLEFEDKTTQVISGVSLGQVCGLNSPIDAPPALAEDLARIEVLQAGNVDSKLSVKRLNATTVVAEDDALSSLDGSVMGAAFDPNFCNLGGKGCSCLAGSCGVGLACDPASNKCVISSSASLLAPSLALVVAMAMTI